MRLTKCLNKQESFYGKDENWVDEDERIWERNIIDKLGKLEDLEELLGCSLETIFKAINQGYIYALRSEELVKVNVNMLNFEDGRLRGCSFSQTTSIDNYLQCYTIENYTNGYGVSWWLKEDRSE